MTLEGDRSKKCSTNIVTKKRRLCEREREDKRENVANSEGQKGPTPFISCSNPKFSLSPLVYIKFFDFLSCCSIDRAYYNGLYEWADKKNVQLKFRPLRMGR